MSVPSVSNKYHILGKITLPWNIDGLFKSKYLSLFTLIPQLDIVRTQSPFWKSGSVRHIAARGGGGGGRLAMFSYVFMKLAWFYDECSWLRIFARFHFWKSRNCRNATKTFFCLSLYFKIQKFIFHQSESYVLTMSSWSRRVKLRGLKSSIEVQQPTVNGNLMKMLYYCLCTSFVSCYCVLTEKIVKNGSVVTIVHFSRLRVRSLLVSYGDSNVWPGWLLQATVTVRSQNNLAAVLANDA